MRQFIVLLVFCMSVSSIKVMAQAPLKMSYQSVVRNSTGNLVANSNVNVRTSILQGNISGSIVYMETHAVTTNVNGLATFEIGNGTITLGSMSTIDWANGPFFLKTETDPAGGNNYSITGTSQLLSVPYALYAEKSGNNQWQNHSNGIYYSDSRVAIGTTPNPIVPLTIFDNTPNGNGNAVLHLKSNDTWHTGMTMFNGTEPNWKYYSFVLTGPANSGAVPGTFGLFNHNSTGYTFNINPTTNYMAIGSNTGYYTKDPKSRLHVFNGDVNIDQIGSGIIMKSPNGNCWRVTIDDNGNFIKSAISCP